MNVQCYLVLSRQKNYPYKGAVPRVTKGRPERLAGNEIAVRLSINVPDALFIKPQIEATISVPEDAPVGHHVTAETINNIEEVISRELGIDMKVSVPEIVEAES